MALDNSDVAARAKKGKGGNILISGFLFQSPNSLVTADSELSANGKLNLKPETNISGSIAVLPESLLNATQHLKDHCSFRSGEKTNRFVVKSRGSIPLDPGELTPSTFLDYPSITNHLLKDSRFKDHPGTNNFQLSSLSMDCD
jgi:large exoprotein involved in heme utilization and adhesion